MPTNYGTVEGYKAYCVERNNPHATDADAEILAALIIASEWLDGRYRTSFPGLKVGGREQEREWPRTGATDIYGYAISAGSVPSEVVNATYEATHRELDSAGSLSVDYTPNKYKSATVQGAVGVVYNTFDNALEAQTKIMIVDTILGPLLTGKNFTEASPYAGSSVRA